MKIVSDIDLKILLKYGFKRIPYINYYQKTVYYDSQKMYSYIQYTINTKTRLIEINTVNIGHYKALFVIDDTLYNLMKDNLIEKLESKGE